jgi:hypothetical protein
MARRAPESGILFLQIDPDMLARVEVFAVFRHGSPQAAA